jgi:hypothetical protein
MASAFGFSVGDLIAGISLIIKSINAVKEGTGSSAEYQAVTATLAQIKAELECLDKIKLDDPAERHALKISASNCGQTISQFLGRISKYDTGLREFGLDKKWKSALRKVQWAMYSKDDICKFQAHLQGNLLCLQTTLLRIHITSTTI